MDITEIINSILAVCGGITIVGGAIALIIKAFKPATDLEKRVHRLEEKAAIQEAGLNDSKKMQAAQIQAQIAILDHMITGNHIEGMKQTRENLIRLLAESA